MYFFYLWSSNPYFHVDIALTPIYVCYRKNLLTLFERIRTLKKETPSICYLTVFLCRL